jgi:hypothetical protein
MCATLGDYPCPMYKIINFSIAMLHFVLIHNVTRKSNSLLLRIHVHTSKVPQYYLHFGCHKHDVTEVRVYH